MADVTSFDRTRIALREQGPRDAPLVVLVHGLGLSMESWGEVPALLAPEHRVVGYDLRGHGQSGDAQTGDYTMQAHARDLGAVLDHLTGGGDRPAVVVGNSLGGGVLLAYAGAFGTDRLAGVVFAGSGGSRVTAPGFGAPLPRWAHRWLRPAWFRLLRGTAVLGRRLRPARAVSDAMVRRFAFTPDTAQRHVDRVRESFLSSRPLALAGTTVASVSHDGSACAPALDVPTVVLHGDRDPEVPQDDVAVLLSRLPQAELVTIPGAGHMLPLTHAQLVAEYVARLVTLTRN
jgi:pimeloyl-ACP methyl ester carboxylesterase